MRRLLPVVLSAGLFSCAGAGAAGGAGSQAPSQERMVGDCEVSSGLRPVAADHVGGALALGDLDGRRLAFVADEDDKLLHVLDVDERKELATQALAGIPAQVMVGASGRVLVTLRDAGVVQVFVPEDGGRSLAATCTAPVAAEPFGLAESRDGSTVVVTSGWGHALDVLRGSDLTEKTRVTLAREPRGVLVSDDGRRATVTHMVGSRVSVVDLAVGVAREVDVRGSPPMDAPSR